VVQPLAPAELRTRTALLGYVGFLMSSWRYMLFARRAGHFTLIQSQRAGTRILELEHTHSECDAKRARERALLSARRCVGAGRRQEGKGQVVVGRVNIARTRPKDLSRHFLRGFVSVGVLLFVYLAY
jgi:hypothetical protein